MFGCIGRKGRARQARCCHQGTGRGERAHSNSWASFIHNKPQWQWHLMHCYCLPINKVYVDMVDRELPCTAGSKCKAHWRSSPTKSCFPDAQANWGGVWVELLLFGVYDNLSTFRASYDTEELLNMSAYWLNAFAMQAAREIAQTMSTSNNKTYLSADSLLLNLVSCNKAHVI